MQYVCDASPTLTWFRIETEVEALRESEEMEHAVEKHFRQAREAAARSWKPPSSLRYIEQDIGKTDHIERMSPLFLTLRDSEGKPHVTAMLPPRGRDAFEARPVVVGRSNSDPYPAFADAIERLAEHYGVALDAARCYPYRRR